MKIGWKGYLFALAALAVAAMVFRVPGNVATHVATGFLGLVALDSLAGALTGAKHLVLGTAGASFAAMISEKLRFGLLGKGAPFILETPTEEIDAALARGRKPKLHGYGGGPFAKQEANGGVLGRLEENYLYSTRRFPNNVTNNTIGSGAVTAGDYNFFTNGVGDQGTTVGYASISSLTYQQTNMAPSGKIPTGRGFKLFDLAVSFNASAVASDISQLLDTCNLRFQKQAGQLVVQHGPIILWPGGVGLSGFAATAVGGSPLTIQGASNGSPTLQTVRRARNPRILSSNEDFSYIVNAASTLPKTNAAVALSDFVEMRIWLYGFVVDTIPN